MLGDTDNTGWKCPGCERCYAPWVLKCDTCGGTSETFVVPAVEECQHVWGAQTTAGISCIKCGELSKMFDGTITICDKDVSCNVSNCSVCKEPLSEHFSNCGGTSNG